MTCSLLVTALVSILAFTSSTSASNIDHFVVLMLENRAFDHMCGWLKSKNSNINGLTGNEYNELNGQKYYVNGSCPYVNPFDPSHDYTHVTQQLMGSHNSSWWIDPAPMTGFVLQAQSVGNSPPANVMEGFTPDRVPVISALAQEFALFDEYFVSFPGETVTNRVFFNMGHSDSTTGPGPNNAFIAVGWNGTSIYDMFDSINITWKGYYEDISDLLYMRSMRTLPNLFDKLKPYNNTFFEDAANGELPQFSWVSPRYYADFGSHPRDQHPDHDVLEGERIISEVYEALRKSPKWNRTALLITYDEHGGFYDHVSPPYNIPNPIPGSTSWDSTHPFNFTRGGMRVCTILASPWVPKGTVVHGPPAGANSAYEHCSIYNTLKNLFDFPNTTQPLSARQAWAAPYDWLLNMRSEPRTDCLETLPMSSEDTAERSATLLKTMQDKKPNGLQKEFYVMVEALHGRDGAKDVDTRFSTQLEMGQYVKEQHRLFLEKSKGK